MKTPEFAHLRWLGKYLEKVRYNLATSAVRGLTLSEVPLPPGALPLDHCPIGGDPELKEHIASLYGVEPSEVYPTAGASEANFLAAALNHGSGKPFVVESPVYHPLGALPQVFGCPSRPLKRRWSDGFRFKPEEVPRKAGAVIITNLHNPTGTALDKADLKTLAGACDDAGALLISDEVYRDFAVPRPPSAIEFTDRAIVTGSLSKVYGLGGLKVGWLVGPRGLVERARKLRELTTGGNPLLNERMTLWALEHREYLLKRTHEIARRNRAIVEKWMEATPEVSWVPPAKWCIIGLVRLPKGVSGLKFATYLAEKESTLVVPGEYFGAPGSFRLGFGGLPEVIKAGLERVGKALANSR